VPHFGGRGRKQGVRGVRRADVRDQHVEHVLTPAQNGAEEDVPVPPVRGRAALNQALHNVGRRKLHRERDDPRRQRNAVRKESVEEGVSLGRGAHPPHRDRETFLCGGAGARRAGGRTPRVVAHFVSRLSFIHTRTHVTSQTTQWRRTMTHKVRPGQEGRNHGIVAVPHGVRRF
jgi:hypothetical protein